MSNLKEKIDREIREYDFKRIGMDCKDTKGQVVEVLKLLSKEEISIRKGLELFNNIGVLTKDYIDYDLKIGEKKRKENIEKINFNIVKRYNLIFDNEELLYMISRSVYLSEISLEEGLLALDCFVKL